MDMGEILRNSLLYPLQNIKALVIFIVLGVIAGISGGTTTIDFILDFLGINNIIANESGILGMLLFIIISLLIVGYMLDVVKWSIYRRSDSPGIDIKRQFSNALKFLVVEIVYLFVPFVVFIILSIFLARWIVSLIGIVLFIIFALAELMARCRLAKNDSLSEALAINEAMGDIFKIGLIKIIFTVVLAFIMAFVLFIVSDSISDYNSVIGGIVALYFVTNDIYSYPEIEREIMNVVSPIISFCFCYLECLLVSTIFCGVASVSFEKEQYEKWDKHAKFVPSGGQGSDEVVSEAECMKCYLMDQGIPEERILKEDKSVNTYQNMAFSKKVIEADSGDLSKAQIAFSTTNYHVFRGYTLAEKLGIKVKGISAKTKLYFFPNAFLREFIGLLFEQKKRHLFFMISGVLFFTGLYYVLNY